MKHWKAIRLAFIGLNLLALGVAAVLERPTRPDPATVGPSAELDGVSSGPQFVPS